MCGSSGSLAGGSITTDVGEANAFAKVRLQLGIRVVDGGEGREIEGREEE